MVIDNIDFLGIEGEIADAKARQDVGDLKSAVSDIDSVLFDTIITDLTPAATRSGYMLAVDSGYMAGKVGYSITAFAVSPGDVLHLTVAHEYTYQATYIFQDSLTNGTIKDGVPTSAPNGYLVGDVNNDSIDGDITVPSGAAYLIISYNTETGYVVQKLTKENEIDVLSSEISAVDSKVGALTDLDMPADNLVDAINKVAETISPEISVQHKPIKASTIAWENKGISANNGNITSNTARLKCVNPLPAFIGAIQPASGYQYGIFAYDSGTFVGWWDGASYTKINIRWMHGATDLNNGANNNAYDLYIVVKNTANTDVSAANIDSMISFLSAVYPVVDSQNDTVLHPVIRNGSNGNVSAANSVAMATILPCTGLSSVGIIIKKPKKVATNHYKISVATYSTATPYATGYTDATSALIGRKSIVLSSNETTYVFDLRSDPTVKGIAFDVDEYDNTDTAVQIRTDEFKIGDVTLVLNRQPTPDPTENFMICPWFGKRPVYVPLQGYTIKYGQAFLMYDGKIYSTDGSHVAEQNSSYEVLRDVVLSLGHGNSFQLGSNGKGYVSGWNDNKLYIVDLADLTIDSVIDLPTTGYTTAAVNEDAGLIYIFQRDSYPNTFECYNLIIYDYVNDETLETYKTPISMRTMQSIDYFRGRIFVVCGSTGVSTHGFFVFDTMGNLVCEYKLPEFDGKEPEGVFIDRTDGTVYLMFDNKGLYKIVVG